MPDRILARCPGQDCLLLEMADCRRPLSNTALTNIEDTGTAVRICHSGRSPIHKHAEVHVMLTIQCMQFRQLSYRENYLKLISILLKRFTNLDALKVRHRDDQYRSSLQVRQSKQRVTMHSLSYS